VKIDFQAEVDGVPNGNYPLDRIFRMYFDDVVENDYTIEEIFRVRSGIGTILAGCTVNGAAGDGNPDTDDVVPVNAETDPATGKYVFVIGGCDQPLVNSRYFVRLRNNDLSPNRVNAVADFPAAPDLPPGTTDGLANPPDGRLLVFSETCQACHGVNASNLLHNANPFNPDLCTVCHDGRYNETLTAVRFPELAHGVHRSHHFEFEDEAGDLEEGFLFEDHVFRVTFPTHMNNCSICHGTGAALDYVQAQTVSYSLCLTCHQNFDGFGDLDPSGAGGDFGGVDHTGFTEGTNCLACHGDTGAALTEKDQVREFHNGYLNDSGHCQQLIWDGQDVSVVEGAKFDQQITGVTIDASNPITVTMSVNWQATYDGVAVDPCNADIANGPVWDGDDAGNQSLLRGYFQGDDIVNANLGTNPGQARSTNLSTTNTTCANNVATSTITLHATEVASTATKARVGLQGTPRLNVVSAGLIPQDELVIRNPGGNDDCINGTITVRAQSPTYDFVKATGAAATPRRDIVDTTGLCTKCHVGTLYQHGGNRIDNVDLCVMCHNPAANEKNRRVGLYGVDASEAYDGLAAQTFEMKTMAHAVHSAGENERLFVIYRGRGIFAWDGPEDEILIPNWPGQGCQRPFGADDTYAGSASRCPDRPGEEVHHFHSPTFPRRLNDCEACHKPGTAGLPDPSMAVGTTLDAGDAADWGDQLDDVLQGPAAAACTSCHLEGDNSDQAALRAHVNQNGFTPQAFPNGRQTILDLDPTAIEACDVCHGD
jgi:OmcA/MtrC family decaheme c-type cytochrome